MITPDANRLVIETDDAVSFSLLLATPLVRALALIIDLGVIYVCQSILAVSMMLLTPFFADISTALLILGYFVTSIGYFILLEIAWDGRTIGKRLMKLRVIDANIQRLSAAQIILRNLFRVVDMLPAFYSLGGLIAMSSRKFQRLGDLAASTLVIRHQSQELPNIPSAAYNKFNSFRRYPHLEAQLKKNTVPAEHSLALQAILRRDKLETLARLELFRQLAQHFRQKVRFPAEACQDLTDEQYVRNCVDSILRNRISANTPTDGNAGPVRQSGVA
ncbi:RDD family protein [Ruficoccus sp. ZRK36]|uniref:RDD family protein n=1 Tax=Ruficoccus sp. ZRK36 TaxID=2866311 RepID=UPI001C729EAA|nr:RDD family protein [Ruficoccus sp. ZRK36]QYY35103.1 RDD family protein [Ruficoccus sp. ZRK36]